MRSQWPRELGKAEEEVGTPLLGEVTFNSLKRHTHILLPRV